MRPLKCENSPVLTRMQIHHNFIRARTQAFKEGHPRSLSRTQKDCAWFFEQAAKPRLA